MTSDDIASAVGTDAAVDQTQDSTGNGGNESYHGYSVDDETQPQSTGDSLVDDDRGLVDPLDEGYSPPETWSAGQGYGNTPLEEALGETLDQRLAQEVPEPDPYVEAEQVAIDELDSEDDLPPDVLTREVGDDRAGRLVAPDEGMHTDVEADAVAMDVGIDGAGAGAEEAAVHVVDEDDLPGA